MDQSSQVAMSTKSHTFAKVGIVVLVALFGIAGAAWGFLRYSLSPEAKILESFDRLSTIKSASYEGSAHIKGELGSAKNKFNGTLSLLGTPAAAAKKAEVTITVKGKFEQKTKEVTNFENNITTLAKTDEKEYPSFSLDFSNIESVSYVRIPKIPALLGFDFSGINNQWISFDPQKLKDQLEVQMNPLMDKPADEPLKQKKSSVILENLKRTAAVQPPITVTKKLKSEKINGVTVQPYIFILNKKNAFMILDKLAQNQAETNVTLKDVEDVKKMMNEMTKFEGKIWVGTKDILPYHVQLTIVTLEDSSAKPIELTIDYSQKDFNKSMNIVAPKESMTIEDAIAFVSEKFKEQQQIMNPPESEISTSTVDLYQIDTDGDKLTDGNEVHQYHTNPLQKDTDGDGYDDGMEVKSGHDPLKR